MLLASVALAGCGNGALPPEAVRLTRGEVSFSGGPTGSAGATDPVAIELPHAWRAQDSNGRVSANYRFDFELPAREPAAMALYTNRLRDGGAIRLDGALLAQLPGSDARTAVFWRRPLFVDIPTVLLGPGRHVLEVQVTPAAAGGDRRLFELVIGPTEAMRRVADWRGFVALLMPRLSVALTAVVATFLALIWWRRRHETVYGLFALGLALWSLRTLYFCFERVPAWAGAWWAELGALATGAFVVAMAVFMHRLGHRKWPWLERLYVGYLLLGVAVLAAFGQAAGPFLSLVWQALLVPPTFFGIGVALRAAWRGDSRAAIVWCLGLAVAAVAGVHDYLVLLGLERRDAVPWLPFAALAALMTTALALVQRFVSTLDSYEALTGSLEARVAQREAELAENFSRLGAFEREQARVQERQRIVQDMHDGMGSHLVSALMRVENDRLDQAQVAQVLREVIDDLRLSIDTLSSGDYDFQGALGNLLARIDQRVRSAGIALRWDNRLPDDLSVGAQPGLQLLRILQEALTNALRHAHARVLEVSAFADPATGQLTLALRDDGRGFDAAGTPPESARGLRNMRDRAQRIGATLRVASGTSGASGTEVRVDYPLGGHEPGAG